MLELNRSGRLQLRDTAQEICNHQEQFAEAPFSRLRFKFHFLIRGRRAGARTSKKTLNSRDFDRSGCFDITHVIFCYLVHWHPTYAIDSGH